MSNAKFISLEGVEGVGKSTCLNFLKETLEQHGIGYIVTREPGGTQISEAIRQLLLAEHQETMVAETELFLMFAARIQHYQQVIKPALAAGQWVVCDRFSDASLAYQGGGRGIAISKIQRLIDDWLEGIRPNLTILLDAPLSVSQQRLAERSQHDRIEKEASPFFARVKAAYLQLAKLEPKRFHIINAAMPLNEVQAAIHQLLKAYV